MSRIHDALKQARHGQEPDPFAEMAAAQAGSRVQAGSVSDWSTVRVVDASPVPELEPSVLFADDLDGLRDRCVKRAWRFDAAYNVFSGNKGSLPLTEQFRKLRSKLYEARKSQALQTLLITSTVPAEGKTFVALNLALAIARQNGRRVLLVDGDLRMPKLSSCLGVSRGPGLTEFLRGEADEASIIQSDPASPLFFIGGGSAVANPTEILASEKLQALFSRLAPLFDWIIVDSPPVLPVSDAGVLATHCDGVLVVVRAGSTGYDAVGAALKELRGKKLLGVVLNQAEQCESFYDGGSYYAGSQRLAAS